ncbi:MAG: RluA family pseudouridine synthase [Deltaproteobacteria bacterium]|nr:RluA family pseudouridine synthase [Deltaproteobacteria bacterium]
MDIARIFTVSEDDSSKRLDLYLASVIQGLSPLRGFTRSAVKNLIDRGKVLVNNRQVKAGYALKTGDSVSVELPGEKPPGTQPEAIALGIIYEDDDIIVIDKQAGLSVHPGAGRASGTLVNALLNHTKNLSNIDPQRPGIVHRLDMDTTGVLVVAKNNASHESLARQFKEHTTTRRYQALVRGTLREDEGIIDLPIGRAALQRKKMSTRARKSRKAVTRWKALRRYPGLTLVELMPETGRTHQLRVHLSAINRPVVGDQVYGGKGLNPLRGFSSNLPGRIVDKLKGVKRQLLHAGTLGIKHPATGVYMEFSSPLPADMGGIIKLLDEECSESGKKTA